MSVDAGNKSKLLLMVDFVVGGLDAFSLTFPVGPLLASPLGKGYSLFNDESLLWVGGSGDATAVRLKVGVLLERL